MRRGGAVGVNAVFCKWTGAVHLQKTKWIMPRRLQLTKVRTSGFSANFQHNSY